MREHNNSLGETNNPGHMGSQFADLNMKGRIVSPTRPSRQIRAWL